MSKQQIKIRIFPDGRIESETINIKGKDCLKKIKDIEQLTDTKVVKSEFTEEYHQSSLDASISNEVRQSSGN